MLHKNPHLTQQSPSAKQNKKPHLPSNVMIRQQSHLNSQSLEQQIKYHLQGLVQQKNYMNKLIISCILSSLYIQQCNYQKAHEILTGVEKTISKLESTEDNLLQNLRQKDPLQLTIIKLKMYSNFILIQLINLESNLFQQHLEQALQLIQAFKQNPSQIREKSSGNHSPFISSQNSDPNSSSSYQTFQTTIMLFQLFLKQFTGFESFEKIQAETLFAECHTEKHPCENLEQFFYFSNVSFLKLLTTSDYQSAFKLQNSSYEFIQAGIQTTRRNREQISLKQVILKTVSLKKLIYLSEQLKLPSQIIKKYKQQLNSSESLKSRYLDGLLENTIFRNYTEKIDLGFRLVCRLKEFEKEVILPLLITVNSKKARQINSAEDLSCRSTLKLWECKALKNKFFQILQSKALENNPQSQDNLLMMIECLETVIERKKGQNCYSSKNSSSQISVEETLLLQIIGQSKSRSRSITNVSKNKKLQSHSLYDSAIAEYLSKIQIFTHSIHNTILHSLKAEFFQKLQESQEPEIEVEISHAQERSHHYEKNNSLEKSHASESSESEPSIYLENVEFQVVDSGWSKMPSKVQNHIESKLTEQKRIHTFENKSKSHQYDEQSVPKYQVEPNYLMEQKQQIPRKLSPSIQNEPIYHSKITPSLSLSPSNCPQKSKLSPRKNIFLNQKNQVYMNYAELGSRVKLSQHNKPQQSSIQESNHQSMVKVQHFQSVNHQNKTKIRPNYQESIKKEEGEIEIPHEDSVVKFGTKKYTFEEKEVEPTPLSHKIKPNKLTETHFVQTQKEKEKQKGSIFQKFKLEKSKLDSNSHVVQNFDDQKSIDQNKSLTRSRKKLSSLSPKIPKDSTINSRLNDHIKRHELTYSPESMASGIKQKKQSNQFINQNEIRLKQREDQKEKSVSEYSAGLSPSSRSVTKNRPKVQKASVYPKSPISSSNPFQTKTIKFKEYMENLEKSGINIREEQPPAKNTLSKVKIESKSAHRRIATEVNETQFQKYDTYMNEENSKIKPSQTNNKSNILDAFLSDPQQRERKEKMQKKHNIFERLPSEQGSSPENSPKNLSYGVVPKTRRTGSELIKASSQQSTVNKQLQKQIKKTQFQQNDKNKPFTASLVPSSKSQKNQMKKPSSESRQNEPLSSIISSPEFNQKLILKMIKMHQQKLNHAIKLCQNGQYIDKKHYSSDGGDERFLQLSSDHKFIEWAVSQNKLLEGHKTKYEMKFVKGVVYGKVTDTMRKLSNKHLEPYKCISFIFQKRTFDIYCSEEQDIKFWLPGISSFIAQSRPQLNHPNYTTKIQKFIKKREIPLKKDDLHANCVYYSLGRVLWKRMLLKMQFHYLKHKKTSKPYKITNCGAIIEFGKAMAKEKQSMKVGSMLPPTGKESKISREKSLSMNSRVKHELNPI